MRKLITALALTVGLPVTAHAQTYDAFGSFNATQGAGNFVYGDVTGLNSPLALYGATTNCFIDGSICLQKAANHDVPGVTKSTSPSFQYGTVNVPTDRLLVHPSSSSDILAALFLTPTTGAYTITATFNVQDVNPTGVGISLFTSAGGVLPIVQTPLFSLSAANPTYTYTSTLTLNANDVIGFGIDNGGFYGDDSTGLNFSVQAVPEPATWAMMVMGFGLVGFGLRSRRATRVTYA